MSDSDLFRKLLTNQNLISLAADQIDRLVQFRESVLVENEIQNLTRLLSPRDFFEGHVLDVLHLKKTGWITAPTLDLGSGMGVPGLLYALLFGGNWVLSDSEKSKADFMSRTIDGIGLCAPNNVKIFTTNERAEEYIQSSGKEIRIITSRAVGTVTKIFGWIGKSSTWNTLILFKGPKWEEEWAEFQRTAQRKRLKIQDEYSYLVGSDDKKRKLIKLTRE